MEDGAFSAQGQRGSRRQAPQGKCPEGGPQVGKRAGSEPRLPLTMLLAVLLLLLPLPDPRSVHGHPLYMRLPPSTLQGEPGLV